MLLRQVVVAVSNNSSILPIHRGWPLLFYLIIAFIVAFCSMSYELVLAQSITLLYGSTVLNYTLIVGIYIFSLGMGSALHARYGNNDTKTAELTFCKIEFYLCAVGGLSPFLILVIEILVGQAPIDLVTPFAAILALGIGLLSGKEIPLLLSVASGRQNSEESSRRIIGLDFIGTFAAAAIIPLVCFPTLGILRTAVVTACLNCVVAIALLWPRRRELKPLFVGFGCATVIGMIILAVFAVDVGDYLFKEIF